jgi:ParB family chromosome partitioning protein
MSMKVQEVKLSDIKGPAVHIRTETRELDSELVESIRTHGLKQPILLRPLKPPYQIVAGLKRFEAFKKLQYKAIPAIIEDLNDKTAYELMLTENIQRKNLTPMEEAAAFREYLR